MAAKPTAKAKKAVPAQTGAAEPSGDAPGDAAGAVDAQLADAPAKKKRNNNPGIRVQGGRVYDSENGTTCHQCRQKTAEIKAKCSSCTLYFCPKCLENRYQEKVAEVNALASWGCPRCRGDCNCSNCRKKAGKEATGQLAGIAKKAGFGSVKNLLDKNPHAKALQLHRAPSASSAGGSSGGSAAASGGGGGGKGLQRKRQPAKRKAAEAAAAAAELVADEQLPAREHPMPEPQPLVTLKTSAGAAAKSKRPRGGLAWLADVPEETALPGGQAGAELAVVLEFLQVFGSKLQLRAPSLAAFAAELLQPAAEGEAHQLLCPRSEDSLVAAVHCRLLDVVRAYWNVRGASTAASWQGTMRGYYAASLFTQSQSLNLRWQYGPPAVSGELFTRPPQQEGFEGEEERAAAASADGQGGSTSQEGCQLLSQGGPAGQQSAAVGVAPISTDVAYPLGGYWGVQPAVRVAMLHALVHDALDCGEVRKCIEESMGDALDEERERKQQLAGVRKEARVAVARERDQQIALMIASASTGGLTLEEQQAMLEEARQRAEAAATQGAAAKVKALTEKVHPPTVRAAVLGCDRDGRRYLQLQAAPLFTGEGGVVVQEASSEEGAPSGGGSSSGVGASEALGCYSGASLAQVAATLHPQGQREGPLQAALLHAFKLQAPLPPPRLAGPADAGGGAAAECGGGKEQQGAVSSEGTGGGVEPVAAAGRQMEAAAVPAMPAMPAGSKRATVAAAAGQHRRRPLLAPAATGPAPVAAEAGADAPQAAKRGRKPAAARDAVPRAAASQPAPAAADGKRRRQGSEGASTGVRAKRARGAVPQPAAAESKRTSGSRRTSPRDGRPQPAEADKAATVRAGRQVGGRTRAAAQQLPLKVDDMLEAC
ncbi:hypothetical protein D9Q98_008506 [Chlorella vulgaris]|uniref:Zinc-finger domain-containing protein n=1 Tax=Chlorella vulgaris TaxID=3077 RepID=A0A9D4TI62_CHLVU|nr:hypothetical protein D9Q98_008506 [Chlorella vulgaris]